MSLILCDGIGDFVRKQVLSNLPYGSDAWVVVQRPTCRRLNRFKWEQLVWAIFQGPIGPIKSQLEINLGYTRDI